MATSMDSGGIYPYDPHRQRRYITASGAVGTSAYYPHIPVQYEEPVHRPEPSKLILPSRVLEEIEQERRDRAIANRRAMFSDRFGGFPSSQPRVNPPKPPKPGERVLTDFECLEEFGGTLTDLKESVDYWQAKLDNLERPRWIGKKAAQREFDDLHRSLRLAVERVQDASSRRVPIDAPQP